MEIHPPHPLPRPEPSFLTMPDFFYQRLIDENGFKTLFLLRQVCKPLRQIIDNEFKLDLKLEWMLFSVITNGVIVRFGTDVKVVNSHDRLKQGKLVIVFVDTEEWRVLELLLKFQRTTLKWLHLDSRFDEDLRENRKFLEKFKTILSIRPTTFRTKLFYMKATDQSQVLQILPSIEQTSLESIHIEHPKISGLEFKIDEIEQLPHFKNVKDWGIGSWNHNFSLHQFLHIPIFHLRMETVSANELICVIDKLINVPTFLSFLVDCKNFNDLRRLKRILGAPEQTVLQVRPDYRRKVKGWWFKTAGSQDIFLVHYSRYFSKKKMGVKKLSGEEAEPNRSKAEKWIDWLGVTDTIRG